MVKSLMVLLFSLLIITNVYAAPDSLLSITPAAVDATTITAADENARNNAISTAYNAHSHGTVDINAGTISGVTFDGTWTAASQTCTDLGSVTTADINGGTIDATTVGFTSATTVTGTNVVATTNFLAPNGTAAAPSYSFTADKDSGMFISSGTVNIVSSGVTQMGFSQAASITINSALYPTGAGSLVQGNGSTTYWDTIYADDFTNVADFFDFDDKKDVEDINNIKPSGLTDEYGRALIDDDTLPEYILARDKEGNIIKTIDKDKPSISLKAAISLCFGAIRQLDKDNKELKQTVIDLEKRIEKLENK